jgi:hypothetical protein
VALGGLVDRYRIVRGSPERRLSGSATRYRLAEFLSTDLVPEQYLNSAFLEGPGRC